MQKAKGNGKRFKDKEQEAKGERKRERNKVQEAKGQARGAIKKGQNVSVSEQEEKQEYDG